MSFKGECCTAIETASAYCSRPLSSRPESCGSRRFCRAVFFTVIVYTAPMPIEANTLNAHESANSVRLSGVRVRFDQQQHRRGSRNRQSVGIELVFSISASQGTGRSRL
jgi:hypothetical protein